MAITATLRFKRFLQLIVVASSLLAVLISVKTSAGIQGSGLKSFAAIGTVSTVGSGITVGGVTYSTSNATFTVDGVPANQGQLRNGHIVFVFGTVAGGNVPPSASEVIFNGNVQGAVSGIDVLSGTFYVLGQTVRVDSGTIFGADVRPSSLAGLSNGVVVEVSAFANSAGELVASRIDVKGRSSEARVVGSLQSLDTVRHTFRINSLAIDYHRAAVGGVLADGMSVVVQGTQFSADGSLIASRIDASPVVNGKPDSDGRIEGLITRFDSPAYFEVDGQPVAVDAQTKLLVHGSLGLDVRVKVTGTFDSNGVLVAGRIQSTK